MPTALRRTLFCPALLLALGTAACQPDSTEAALRGVGTRPMAGPIDALTAEQFVERAASSGMLEVQSAQLALDRQLAEPVRSLAQQMLADHRTANEQLARVAANANLQLPATLAAEHDQQLERLRELQGDAFTTRYLELLHEGHVASIDLFERAAAELREHRVGGFAADTLPTLRHHLEMVRERQQSRSGR